MRIVDTPEKDVSEFDRKLEKRKILTSSINSLSTLFSCPILAMYNSDHRDQNKFLMLKPYITGINTSILPNKYGENIFSEKWSMNYIPLLKVTLM